MITGILIVIALGCLVRSARGGSLADLAERRFQAGALALAGVVLNVIAELGLFPALLARHPGNGPLPLGAILHLSSYLFLIAFFLANRAIPGIQSMLIGTLLNAVVIVANGGRMPIDPAALNAMGDDLALAHFGSTVLWASYTLQSSATPLALLGDWIVLPIPFHSPIAVSIGDLWIAVGCFSFCARRTAGERDRAARGSSEPLSSVRALGRGGSPDRAQTHP